MESELPSQGTELNSAHLTPQDFGMLELGKIAFGLCLKQHWIQTTVWKHSKKAGIMTTTQIIKDIL